MLRTRQFRQPVVAGDGVDRDRRCRRLEVPDSSTLDEKALAARKEHHEGQRFARRPEHSHAKGIRNFASVQDIQQGMFLSFSRPLANLAFQR